MIFVTGANGMLGSYLLFDLAKRNYKIRALKLKSTTIDNVTKIFSLYSTSANKLIDKIQWVEGNILDYDYMLGAMEGVNQVYHLAAINSSNPADKEKLLVDNVKGTENIVNAALKMNVEKLCYVSTVSALAMIENKHGVSDLFITEKTPVITKTFYSDYAIGKYYSERIVKNARKNGLNSIIVNPSWCIGVGMWTTGTPVIFDSVWKGLKYYTNGVRGFVDARDVCKSMILLMESAIKNDSFIVSSENCSFKEIFDMIADCLGKKRPYFLAPTIILEAVWRIEHIRQKLTGSKPLLTRGKVKKFTEKLYYSNEKIRNAVDIQFLPVKMSIQHVAKIFLEEH